jgi:hypothetical protein
MRTGRGVFIDYQLVWWPRIVAVPVAIVLGFAVAAMFGE